MEGALQHVHRAPQEKLIPGMEGNICLISSPLSRVETPVAIYDKEFILQSQFKKKAV